MAFSEAIVRGGFGITNWVKLVFHIPQRIDISMWSAMEEKFRKEKELTSDYIDHYYRQQFLSTGSPMERVLIK